MKKIGALEAGGTKMVLAVYTEDGRELECKTIPTLTPEETMPFFARLGFQPEGETENGIRQMLLRGEDLCLDTCQGCKKDCPNRK